MIAQHIEFFAEIYLESRNRIDSTGFNTFLAKEVKLPAEMNDILGVLDEMCKKGRLEVVSANKYYGNYLKVEDK